MKFKLVIFSIVFLLLVESAFSQVQWRENYYTINEVKYTVKISKEDLKDTPSWNPEEEETAPLSLQKAIEIGRTNLKRIIPIADDKWRIWNISLEEMGENKWFYIIEFEPLTRLNGKHVKLGIFIKMDGTIIEPTVTPNDT
ncbi:hypothetical protein BH10ACI1_BH10ACI1_22750 [soil metagenome]